jgi:mannose-6-phosphate isomerase-like protein (cupin superfamily)
MHVFSLQEEQIFTPHKHVEKILGTETGGDFTVACWEAGQVSPFHCHPNATEIYFCFAGGGVMRTPTETVEVRPGAFVVHPPGELHEYENGAERTLLFRVRYGSDMSMRAIGWRGHPEAGPTDEDREYFAAHPPGVTFNPDDPST